MANVVADKLTQANQIKERIRTAANAKKAGIPEGAPFADYPGYLEGLPEQVENMPIALDFSGGDMEIIAPDGVVVKSAVIQKPANLTPENIAEGVNIAGIVGALAAGGGVELPFNIWTKTIKGVSLTQSGTTAKSVMLASSGELPEWADLTNIKLVYDINQSDPIYILGLIIKPKSSSSAPTYSYYANIVTNISNTSSSGPLSMWVGKSVTPTGSSARQWFGTITSTLMGLFVQNGAIYQRAYNGYGVLSSAVTYELFVIKIDPA